MKKVLSGLILLCLCICMISCGKKSQSEVHPSNYEQLSKLIGKTQAEVCEKLDITEEDMKLVNPGLYKIPLEMEFLDASYEVFLKFDVESESMYGFLYQQTFSNDTDEAQSRVKYLLEKLTDFHGEPDTYEGKSERLTEQKAFEKKIAEKEIFSSYEVWDISDKLRLYLNVHSDGESNVTIQLEYRATE